MKIALLQQNFVVSDFKGNVRRIYNGYLDACNRGAEIVVSTELAGWGYPPLDLLERHYLHARHDSVFDDLMLNVGDIPLIVGTPLKDLSEKNGRKLPYNGAVFLHRGRIANEWHKVLLPTYDVFDETRYFSSGWLNPHPFTFNGVKIAILICEDIWGGVETPNGRKVYDRDPLQRLAPHHVDILFVINGSPYYWGKGSDRYAHLSNLSKRLGCTIVYTNQVGGNTDLVFDGRSCVFHKGLCVCAASAFQEQIVLCDTSSMREAEYPFDEDRIEDLNQALVLGVRDYVRKTGHSTGVIGISGGVDSAVTARIACEALGAEHVTGIYMPSEFSPQCDRDDALKLAQNLGCAFVEIPIQSAYSDIKRLFKLNSMWNDPGTKPGDVTAENVQARLRGLILMGWSNSHPGTLVLSTSNKSESAMGYCTLYGDMVGGFAVLSDVWKTDVYKLALYYNREREIIPAHTVTQKPSARLRPNQFDTDSLPPYNKLDAVLKQYIEQQLAPEEMSGDPEVIDAVVRGVQRSEHKRWQMPPGLKVTSKAFGTGRRVPIAAVIK